MNDFDRLKAQYEAEIAAMTPEQRQAEVDRVMNERTPDQRERLDALCEPSKYRIGVKRYTSDVWHAYRLADGSEEPVEFMGRLHPETAAALEARYQAEETARDK